MKRHLADGMLCRRRFTHSRRPMQFDARGYLVTAEIANAMKTYNPDKTWTKITSDSSAK